MPAAKTKEKAEDTAEVTAMDVVEARDAPAAPADPWRMLYHPLELPASTDAAEAFMSANPDAVDEAIPMSEERITSAQQAILDYGSADDPRLQGGSPPEIPSVTPGVTGVDPTSAPKGSAITVVIGGIGLTGTTNVNIGADCTSLNVIDDTQITAVTATTPGKGTYPVVVTVDGNAITGPDFQVT